MEGDAGGDSSEHREEALIAEWQSLRDDVRTNKNHYHRRIVQGTIVLAAVAGYSVDSGELWLLAFIPIIIGMIFISVVQEANNVYYLSWQCVRIERALDIEGFSWTEDFAGLTRPNERIPKTVTRFGLTGPWSYRVLPGGGLYLVGVVVYVFFVIYTVQTEALQTSAYIDGEILGHSTTAVAGVVYLAFTALLVGVGLTHWKIRAEFDEREGRDHESDG